MNDSCFLCGQPAQTHAVMFGGFTMPACNACFLSGDAPCARCAHTVFQHIGLHGPGLPEQVLFSDCDVPDCDCSQFRRSAAQVYYHATHRCGHQAWWSNPELAGATTDSDCPWCGAETKNEMPPLVAIEDPNVGATILPNLDAAPGGGEVLVLHLEDKQCCSGSIITRSSRTN